MPGRASAVVVPSPRGLELDVGVEHLEALFTRELGRLGSEQSRE